METKKKEKIEQLHQKRFDCLMRLIDSIDQVKDLSIRMKIKKELHFYIECVNDLQMEYIYDRIATLCTK